MNKITLQDVCKLPDVQLHSKSSFLKSLLTKQSKQAQQMKKQIVKLSYTVKTIGVEGGQVGIMSKRVPLKQKKKVTQSLKKQYNTTSQKYLPHKTFYSNPLIAIKKQKQTKRQNNILMIIANNPISVQYDSISNQKQIKKRAMTTCKLKNNNKKHKLSNQNYEELGRINNLFNNNTQNKKSFSRLLKQFSTSKKNQILNPLMHQQNPLFKKIKHIKEQKEINQRNSMEQEGFKRSFTNISSRNITRENGRYNSQYY